MKAKSKQSRLKRSNKISFDEEVVNKDQAEKLLLEQGYNPAIPKKRVLERNSKPELKTKVKRNKRKLEEKNSKNSDKTSDKTILKKIQISDNQEENHAIENATDITESSTEQTQEPDIRNQPKKESNRAQKRKKHADLLEQKKLKTELDLQQKALNYLSKWKHSRSEWKFEKLKQVWIQQNLYDASKIPDDFWETTVEYFNGAMGHSRQVALDDAIKIIENNEDSTEENLNEDHEVKLKRARDIVQNLQ